MARLGRGYARQATIVARPALPGPALADAAGLSGNGTLAAAGSSPSLDVSRGLSGDGTLAATGLIDSNITQAAYRFYKDDNSANTSTALAAQDTSTPADTGLADFDAQLRIRLQATSAGIAVRATDDWQLQYERNASGTWVDVVVGGSTVAAYDSTRFTESTATTNRLTGGTGSFVAGKSGEDGQVDDLGWTASNYTEIVYSVRLVAANLTHGDTVRFRVLKNGVTTGVTYTSTPTLTVVNVPVAPTARVLNPSAVTSSTVQLQWNPDNAARPAPTYLVEQSTDGTNFTPSVLNVFGTGNVDATGLSVQPYWFRITGSSSSGSATSAVLGPITTAPLNRAHNTEGGTSGSLVTAANSGSGGDVLNYGGAPSSVGVQYDNTRAHSGTLSMKMTVGDAFIGWDWRQPPNPALGYGTRAITYWRCYLYLTAYPTSAVYIINNSGSGSTAITPTGTVRIGSGGTPSTVPVALNQWVRLEGAFQFGAGAAAVRIFNNSESTTPTETVTGTQTTNFFFGFGSLDTTPAFTYWFDDIAVSDVDWIGPATPSLFGSGTGTLSTGVSPGVQTPVGFSGAGVFSTNRLAVAITQAAYRFYANASPDTGPALAAQDTAYTADLNKGDVNLFLRTRLQSTGAATQTVFDNYQLQWEKNASGTWTNVTVGGSTVAAFNSAFAGEGGPTTNRLGAGTGGFSPGSTSEDGQVDNFSWTPTTFTELLYSLTLKRVDLADTDTLRFRVLRNAVTTEMTYTATPTISVSRIAGLAGLSGSGTLSTVTVPRLTQAAGLSGSGTLSAAGVRLHSIWANSAPPGTTYARFNDGLFVRVGMMFYRSLSDTVFTTGSKIVGARLWCPPGLTMPATVQFSAYLGTYEPSPGVYVKALTDPALIGGEPAPDATVTVPITVSSVTGGWQEVTFPTPLDMPVPGYPVLIAYHFPDAPSDYLAVTDARSSPFTFIQANDGSQLFWSEEYALSNPVIFHGGYYRYEDKVPDWTDGNIGYGIDIRVSEPVGSGTSFSGTANLSGSGALSATAGPGAAGTVGLTGTGSLVGIGQPSIAVPVGLSGSGVLSLVAKPGQAATPSLSGSGSLSIAGVPALSVPLGLSGSGSLGFVSVPALTVAVGLSGNGALTGLQTLVSVSGTLALAGSGSLGLVMAPSFAASVGLSGSGSLGVQTLVGISGTLALSGSGTIAVTGKPALAAQISLTGSGTLAGAGGPSFGASVDLAGSGSLSPTGSLAVARALGFSGSGVLTLTAAPAVSRSISLSGSGSLTTTSVPALAVSLALTGSGALSFVGGGSILALSGTGSLSATGAPALARAQGLSGAGALSFVVVAGAAGSAALTGAGSLAVAGVPATAALLGLSGTGVLSSTTIPTLVGTGQFSGTGALSATAVPALARTLALSGSGVLTSLAQPGLAGSPALSGSGSLATQVVPALAVAASLQGQGTLSTSVTVAFAGQASFAGNGTLLVQTGLAGAALVFLTGSGSLSSSALVAVTGARGLSGDGLLTVAAAPRTSGTLALSGSGSLAMSVVPALAVSLGLSGAGQLAVVGALRASGSIALAGTGSLNAVGVSAGAGLTGLSGSGTLSLTVIPGAVVTQGLSGNGTLSATLVSVSTGIAQGLSGSGLLSATTAPALAAQVQLSGTGALTLTGALRVTALVGLAGSGVLTAAGTGTEQAGSAIGLTGSGSLSTQVAVAVSRAGALSGLGTLSMSVQIDVSVTVGLTGTGTLNLAIVTAFSVALLLSGNGELEGALGIPDTVVVAGIHHLVVHRWVIIGGLKKPVVNTWVIVDEQKHPTVT